MRSYQRFSKRHPKGESGGSDDDAVPISEVEEEAQDLKSKTFQGLREDQMKKAQVQ